MNKILPQPDRIQRTRETLRRLADALITARKEMPRFAIRARAQRSNCKVLAERLVILAQQGDASTLDLLADALGLDR